MTNARPRILLACGYFDWFSGYQETALAEAFAPIADTQVLASDRVNPLFSDEHLARLEVPRRYPTGTTRERGVRVTRVPCIEARSMVWSREAVSTVRDMAPDLIVQVMPGQALPIAASLSRAPAKRVVLYGDNAAMYAALGRWQTRAKFLVFSMSKGVAYRFVNSRADKVYGSTPDTLTRLQPFASRHELSLLPLGFNQSSFFYDADLRASWRETHAVGPDEIVIIAPGKINTVKRFDALITALPRLRSAFGPVRLLFVGADGGRASQELRSQAHKDLSQHVEVLPFADVSTLNDCFNGADIGVWPAMPAITIQQAMGTGLLAVLPDNRFVSHLASGMTSARLFPAGEPLVENLIQAIGATITERLPLNVDDRAKTARGNAWLSYDRIAASILQDVGLDSTVEGS